MSENVIRSLNSTIAEWELKNKNRGEDAQVKEVLNIA